MKKFLLFNIGIVCMAFSAQANEGNHDTHLIDIPYDGTSHYLLTDVGVGLHTLIYKPQGGKNAAGLGGDFELRYQYIPNHIGFGAGIQLSSHRSSSTLNYSFSEEIRHDDNNLECIQTTEFHDWEESQKIITLDIPLLFQFQTHLSGKWLLSMGAGAVVNIPLAGKYQVEKGYLETSGYFGSTNIVYKDLDNHGFLVDKSQENESIDNLRCSIEAQLEAGLLRTIGKKCALYMGLYFNYGLTDCTKNKDRLLFSKEGYSGILCCDKTQGVHLFKTGAKIGFRFDLRDKDREAKTLKHLKELQVQKELEEDIVNTALRLEEERQEKLRQEQIKEEEERERQLEEQKIEAERRIKEAMKETKKANLVLRTLKEDSEYNHFNGTTTFSEENEELFDILFEYLAKNPNAYIKIIGHTDNTKTETRSMELGQRRAESFKRALVMKGLPEERIECTSKGYFEPTASNNTKEGRRINNRTELFIIGK